MLAELLKNSRRSDRDLAKAMGTSQPTATRLRAKLEKDGIIKEYTIVPDLKKAGYELLALTFIKIDPKKATPGKQIADFKRMHYETFTKNPHSVVFMKGGMGLGYDALLVSLHPDYSSCDRFHTFVREKMFERMVDMNTFLISLEDEKDSLPFSFYTLANQLVAQVKKETSNI